MKFFILACSMLFISASYANETHTDCQAINGNREKIVKTASASSKTRSGSTAQ